MKPELAYALVGGSWIFLGGVIFTLVGAVIGIFTRKGSGINLHPYSKVGEEAAGARGPCMISGHDDSDGVLQLHRRRPVDARGARRWPRRRPDVPGPQVGVEVAEGNPPAVPATPAPALDH
jgi:hypothetical protein